MIRSLFALAWLALLLLALPARGAEAELRGAWVARDSFATRGSIAQAMQDLAANNFNVVLVNAWSRGYPLWRSEVFRLHTGLVTDPGYADRDVLGECIEEGHRAGLQVVAWMEYGFVGGYSEYFPGSSGKGAVFDAHPDWLARDRSGNDGFPIPGGGFFYWMANTHPDAQQFLLDLHTEVAARYDLDGIEFDRFRYPQLDAGYDPFTMDLYRSEHDGKDPPDDPADPEWMSWRAAKLTEFVLRAYRSIKSVRPDMHVSSAPATYPFSYDNFLQDYPAWLRAGALDFVTPQVYRTTAAAYDAELARQLEQVADPAKVIPGLAVTNSTPDEVVAMVCITRSHGLRGVVVWYYGALADFLPALKQQVFAEPAEVPDLTEDP